MVIMNWIDVALYKRVVRQLNIKNRTYYFYNDLIKALNFEPINLKLDKKHGKTLICIMLLILIKISQDLMINKVFCSVGEENGVKYLKIERNHSEPALNKWNQVFDSIKYGIKEISNEKVNFNEGFNKIKFISDDSLR